MPTFHVRFCSVPKIRHNCSSKYFRQQHSHKSNNNRAEMHCVTITKYTNVQTMFYNMGKHVSHSHKHVLQCSQLATSKDSMPASLVTNVALFTVYSEISMAYTLQHTAGPLHNNSLLLIFTSHHLATLSLMSTIVSTSFNECMQIAFIV